MEPPITDRHLLHRHRSPQGLTEKYRDVKRQTREVPDFDLPEIQSALRHFYLDGLSRNMPGRVPERGTNMPAIIASPDPRSNICHNCGLAGDYRSGCAVPVKAHGKATILPARRKHLDQGAALGRSGAVCIDRTTTHNSAHTTNSECYAQGPPC